MKTIVHYHSMFKFVSCFGNSSLIPNQLFYGDFEKNLNIEYQ